MKSGKGPRKRFVMQPRPLGLGAGLSYDRIEELLGALKAQRTVIVHTTKTPETQLSVFQSSP
jgi:hypothetical protein